MITKNSLRIGQIYSGGNNSVYEILNFIVVPVSVRKSHPALDKINVAEFEINEDEFKFAGIKSVHHSELRVLNGNIEYARLRRYNITNFGNRFAQNVDISF
ncbi:MAG: hypothetical protein IPM74_18070 [Crocinitomicaceae bacterium]|nr:hypothetical protein [Crocinitomicaceae bacterium]